MRVGGWGGRAELRPLRHTVTATRSALKEQADLDGSSWGKVGGLGE